MLLIKRHFYFSKPLFFYYVPGCIAIVKLLLRRALVRLDFNSSFTEA